jgi:hypothetical protein
VRGELTIVLRNELEVLDGGHGDAVGEVKHVRTHTCGEGQGQDQRQKIQKRQTKPRQRQMKERSEGRDICIEQKRRCIIITKKTTGKQAQQKTKLARLR